MRQLLFFLSFFLLPNLPIAAPKSKVPTYTLVKTFGGFGTGTGQLNEPGPLGVGWKSVYVADSGNHRVVKLNQNLQWVFAFGTLPDDLYALGPVSGIAVEQGGRIWVSDMENNRLVAFNERGGYEIALGEFGTKRGDLNSPANISIAIQGEIAIANSGNDEVTIMSSNGEFRRTVGDLGPLQEKLNRPTAILTLKTGHVIVGDHSNNPLKLYDTFGHFVANLLVTSPNVAIRPTAIASDDRQTIYVADEGQRCVFVLQSNGQFLTRIDEGLEAPSGVCVMGSWVVVSDRKRHQVLAFKRH